MLPLILCVTGPMAAGKNLASKILEEKGFFCIDADLAAHTAIENSREKILSAFGPLASEKGISLTDSEGKINRRNLGAIIFSDAALVEKQEAIVYPEITRILEDFISEHSGHDVVINATVLYKIPLIKQMDAVLFVDSPVFMRFLRAKKRDGMPARQILDRFRNQNNLFAKYKISNADTRRVWNVGSRQSLEKKIEIFLGKCRQGK